MSDTIKDTALVIYERMAVICDCDSEHGIEQPLRHDEECEVTAAWGDALRAAGDPADLYEEISMFEDDPFYSPFEDGDEGGDGDIFEEMFEDFDY
jgi:hypothetical protein